MEDRKANKNTFTQGITLEDQPDTHVPLEAGVSPERGVPVHSAEYLASQEALRGRPWPMEDWSDPDVQPDLHCVGTTLKGNPCKAYAITKGVFCVGHMVKS